MEDKIKELESTIVALRKTVQRKDAECASLDERLEELSGNRDFLIRAHDKEKTKLLDRISELEQRLKRYEKDGTTKNFLQRLFNL